MTEQNNIEVVHEWIKHFIHLHFINLIILVSTLAAVGEIVFSGFPNRVVFEAATR